MCNHNLSDLNFASVISQDVVEENGDNQTAQIDYLQKLLAERDQTIAELTAKIVEMTLESPAIREYEVEEITDHQTLKNGRKEYRVRWAGYSPNADSWEPESNLNCLEKIAEYLKKNEVSSVEEERAVADEEDEVDEEKDDKADADYIPPIAELPKANPRKSMRTKKPVQSLMYTHTPRCALCGRNLPKYDEKDGPSFCSSECLKIFQNKE